MMSQALPRMITRKELRQLVPYCPQHILRLEKAGKFPERVRFGGRRVGWWLHEVLAWIASQNSNRGRSERDKLYFPNESETNYGAPPRE